MAGRVGVGGCMARAAGAAPGAVMPPRARARAARRGEMEEEEEEEEEEPVGGERG